MVSVKTVEERPALSDRVAPYFALPIWVFGLLFAALWLPLSLALLTIHLVPGTVSLGLLAIAMAVPLQVAPPKFVKKFLCFCLKSAQSYFPVTFHYVDIDSLKKEGAPYVIGYEPHSVLPQSMTFFSQYGQSSGAQVAPVFANTRILVSSAGFWAPLMRHLWWWLGCRPVSRSSFASLLKRGHSVALCPGGVQECIYMGPGLEVAYLRRRHGFVRLAIQHGAPLVPVFAFGQTGMYRYMRFFIDWPSYVLPKSQYLSFVRSIGYVPMLIFGAMGTAMPRKVPIDVVVGRPIPVPKIEHPSHQVVQEYLDKFIASMESIFDEYKGKLGHNNLQLKVY